MPYGWQVFDDHAVPAESRRCPFLEISRIWPNWPNGIRFLAFGFDDATVTEAFHLDADHMPLANIPALGRRCVDCEQAEKPEALASKE
ncbi:hypothetical protein ACFV9E_40215 [Streptomyces sp. NPDC059835]|uniref:hypothetical protein n=1 Tax=Streptomyces sp. NPDC059835 TaxID=3346967 RepID=UPI00364D27A4